MTDIPATTPVVLAKVRVVPAVSVAARARSTEFSVTWEVAAKKRSKYRMNVDMRAAMLPGWVKGGNQVGLGRKKSLHCWVVTAASCATFAMVSVVQI
jgi:hypothetical protein